MFHAPRKYDNLAAIIYFFLPFLLGSTTEIEVLSLPLRAPSAGDDAGCLGGLAAHCFGLGGQEREAPMVTDGFHAGFNGDS